MRFSFVPDYEKYLKEVVEKRENPPTEQQLLKDKDMAEYADFSKKFYFGIIETVTEKQFISPDLHREIVLHNKVSGFEKTELISLAKDAQPFSFYEPKIHIYENKYINPISRGSTKIYYFNWTNTIINGSDSVFVIEYQPKKGTTFEGLKGVLYIHSNQYAIQNVIAEPADIVQTSIKIEQKYKYHEAAQKWFPEQYNIEWLLTDYPAKYDGVLVDGKSYIKTVDFNPNLRARDFGSQKYELADDIFKLEEKGWNQERIDTLSLKELKTYDFIDSISKANKLEEKLEILKIAVTGKVDLGKFDLELNRLLSYNEHEKLRVGIGLRTNDDLIKNFSIGGYVGYGFGDKTFKYSGDARWDISKRRKLYLKAGYIKDLKSPGNLELPYWGTSLTNDMMNWFQPVMDNFEGIYAELGSKIMRYGQLKLQYSDHTIQPNGDYTYSHNADEYTRYDFQEIKATLRYAHGEQFTSLFGVELPTVTSAPIFHLNFTTGIWENTNINYQRVVLGVEQNVSLHRLGTFNYHIQAGLVNGDVPWTKLFNSNGLGTGFRSINIRNTFQTMLPNEFLSNQFAHVFLKYNIGRLTKSSVTFQPALSLVHNQAWGKLNDLDNHQGDFKTLEQGFFESGVEVNNLYRMNYLNVGYFGLGFGAYMRHGVHQFENFQDNISYQVLAAFSF